MRSEVELSVPFLHENRVPMLPPIANEPVLNYGPNSPEREHMQRALDDMQSDFVEMPLIIDGKAVRSGQLDPAVIPHDHRRSLGQAHIAGPAEIESAIARRTGPMWTGRAGLGRNGLLSF